MRIPMGLGLVVKATLMMYHTQRGFKDKRMFGSSSFLFSILPSKLTLVQPWIYRLTASTVMTPPHLCRYCPLWGLISLTVLFSLKAHNSGGKGLYTLKGVHSL